VRRLTLILAIAATLVAAAPAAGAAPATFTVNGEPGALVSGAHLVLTPRPTEYAWRNGMVDVYTDDGHNAWELRLGPPQGQPLRRGVYDGALPLGDQTRTRPFIGFSGGARGCDNYGRFQVKDVQIVGSTIKRLWLLYEAYCGPGDVYGMFGEVRIGEPARGATTTIPRMVRWPAGDAKRPTTPAPVVVVASRTTRMGRARIAGSRQFRIERNRCRGRTLEAGDRCIVVVRYRRTTAGTKRARLKFAGSRLSVPLQGFAYGGATRMVIDSDEGDFVGQGRHYRFTLPTADVVGGGGPGLFSLAATRGDQLFDSELAPAPGGRLRTGTYSDARRYPYNGSHPGFDTNGDGRGCDVDTGSFRVKEARYDRYRLVRSFAATLVQHCEGATPALHATLDWRAGDHARRPSWMPGRIVTRR
jgi:hypothetical protein